jgi:excisionase family DNA binding protein
MKDSNPAHALTAPHPADPARPGAATWASERLPTSRSARRELQPLLTLPEVAVLLRLSEKTIRRLLAARRLPCVRLGRQLRFVQSDIVRWVSARKEG